MPLSRATHASIHDPLIVERYAVYDEFAAGGMASVHFARLNGAHGFRRTVAVKRLLPQLTRDRELALMLVDEARLASRVRHHNVVSILDVVQTRDELLLVMEYVHGESLAKLMAWSSERREQLPLAVAVAIVIDALHGLQAAHEASDEHGAPLCLVHRDVSPQNILVGLDGITRIADFGVAKAAGRVQSTRNGIIKGKLAYMAPEQIEGGRVTQQSDVFGMAIVLWEALAGARLFSAENDAERVFKVMAAPIAAPSTRRSELPAALDAIVLRGLARDPAKRYASAREMASALEAAAPSVRPSEIAGWVERVVAGRLAARGNMLYAIERGETTNDDDAVTARRVRTDLLPEAASGRRPSRGLAGEASVQRVKRPFLLGALALLGVVAFTLLREAPRAAQAEQAQTMPSVEAPASAVETAGAVIEPVAPPPLKAAPLPVSERRRVRAARKTAAPSCDPPYSLDAAGRKLFKVECM